MSSAVHIVAITVAVILIRQVPAGKMHATFDILECQQYDVNYAETITCWLQPDRNGELMMNFKFKLKKDLPNLWNKFQLIVDLNKKNVTYMSADMDVCATLGAALKNPILRIVLEETRRKSNLPLACPLKKGIEYSILNFTINSKLIPSFAPRLKWIADSNFYTNTSTATNKLLHFVSGGRIV